MKTKSWGVSALISKWGFCALIPLLFPTAGFGQFPYPTRYSPLAIVSPANRAVFYAPVDIPIFAYARDTFRLVTNVQFFAGSTRLGYGQRLHIATPLSPFPGYLYGRDQFFLVWSNPPPGAYALTAVVANFTGFETSAPVNITVVSSVPPGTNQTDTVSILAIDPLAIEGTNCWIWRGLTNSVPAWTNWPGRNWAWFTNCGPKNATFAVRRFGDCSRDLAVAYRTSGTATNGVHYVTLPGTVTIPAGQADALIPLVPIDDGRPDINRVAVLTLVPSAAAPPNYLVGFPPRAAALIVDSNGPRPLSGILAGSSFHLNADGPDGAWFHVEASTDLLNWSPLCTNQVVNGAIDFVDPDTQDNTAKFYRAVPELAPASR